MYDSRRNRYLAPSGSYPGRIVGYELSCVDSTGYSSLPGGMFSEIHLVADVPGLGEQVFKILLPWLDRDGSGVTGLLNDLGISQHPVWAFEDINIPVMVNIERTVAPNGDAAVHIRSLSAGESLNTNQ